MTEDPASLAGRTAIIGAGLAGLIAALRLAPQPVVIVTKAPLGLGAASGWSQGGLAAAILPDDSPARHAADTIEAGDGLCDLDVVRRITEAGPSAVDLLENLGVRFGRNADNTYACKLEAAHSRRRVLNAGGDGTGAEIMRALIARVRDTPSIALLEGWAVSRLMVGDDGMVGLVARVANQDIVLPTRRIVMATGGCGGLWLHTTNPPGALGQGLAVAAAAGAALIDLEFVQFHPTALDVGRDPMPLATEALRGEGAVLVNELGGRVMAAYARGDLEPRDVVSRAVWAEQQAGHQVSLDARASVGAAMPAKFPTVAAACLAAGIDPVTEPMPIRPAAHYHMGGIAVDPAGRTTLDGLWACGEAAGTGLHGANRLASNSLLEAVTTGIAVADDLAGLDVNSALPTPAINGGTPANASTNIPTIREIMSRHVGVLRDRDGLIAALTRLAPLASAEGMNGAATAALGITLAALRRQESRGGHFRTDFPARDPALAVRHPVTLGDLSEAVRVYGS